MSIRNLTFPVKILGVPLSSTGTRLVLPDIKKWDGETDLTSGEVGTVIYAGITNFTKTRMEIVELDATTLSVATTTGILINKRGLSFTGGTTALEESALDHTANETYVLLGSNPPQILENLVDIDEAQTITGLKTFSGAGVLPRQDTYTPATNAKEFIPKGQLDAAVLGIITADKITVEATAGETVTAGALVYYDTTDKEWKLTDADTAATVENSYLGIAQGAGTDGVAINGGVLLSGLDENQTGMTAGDIMYASNTAGEIANSAGTEEVTVGIAKSATELYFKPRFNQQLTEDEQDALAGSAGTPSADNLFITEADAIRAPIYAVSTTGNDTYVITPNPSIVALADGQRFMVLPDSDNTGACTLNPNALGAKSILLPDGASTPQTGDIKNGVPFEVEYDSSLDAMVMISVPASLVSGANANTKHTHLRVSANATYDVDDGGSSVVAHSLGIAPKWVEVHAYCIETNGSMVTASHGFWEDGGNYDCIMRTDTSPTVRTDIIAGYQESGASDETTATVSVDASNITLTFTQDGAVSAKNIYMLITCGV